MAAVGGLVHEEEELGLVDPAPPRGAPAEGVGHLRGPGCCFARDRANLTGLVLGCIEAKFCKKICV